MTTGSRPPVPRSRLRAVALVKEIAAGLTQRPGRSVMTALGTVLGVGTLVAVLGITATVQGQVSERFDALRATEVTVTQDQDRVARIRPGEPFNAFPADSDDRIAALNGVVHAGLWWPVELPPQGTGVSALPPGLSAAQDRQAQITVYGATPGVFDAARATFAMGRSFDRFCIDREERVVVLGAAAARALGVAYLESRPAVFIDDHPFTVIGIIDATDRASQFLSGAIIPATVAQKLWPLPKQLEPEMMIETALGAAQMIGVQAPLALSPTMPDLFRVVVPPDPHTLKDTVSSDLTSLFLALAGISLLIGAFGIANTTLVSVLERVEEIGLRRAIGARPIHIAIQFLAESALLGTLGGLVGTTLGILTTLAIAIAQHWTAIMPQWLILAGLVGTVTGLIAGLGPARRAAHIEPAHALRR